MKQDDLQLPDGARIGVIGGGPAGSFFSYFCLLLADRAGFAVNIDIYEPRDFSKRGPASCNMCGGIISETLVQTLAAEGIMLPPDVVQRGIEAYVLHTDVGSVRIETPVNEKRIGAVHRGAGPLRASANGWKSFDGFLLDLAVERGARRIDDSVAEVAWTSDRPVLVSKSGGRTDYDLIVIACGVNSTILKSVGANMPSYSPPKTTKTLIREYALGDEMVSKRLGDAMHLYLLNLPRLEFAAAIPKGDCVTVCMLGTDIDRALYQSFMETAAVQEDLSGIEREVCSCSPRMNLGPAGHPYADRVLFVGDCGVARLYKDGIGAAYRTAKAAAAATIFHGVSRSVFHRYYRPACRAIIVDNRFGQVVFLVTTIIQKLRFAQRAVIAMVRREQTRPGISRRMSGVLWDTFTGSAGYRDIFIRTLNPAFLLSLFGHLGVSLVQTLLPGKVRRAESASIPKEIT